MLCSSVGPATRVKVNEVKCRPSIRATWLQIVIITDTLNYIAHVLFSHVDVSDWASTQTATLVNHHQCHLFFLYDVGLTCMLESLTLPRSVGLAVGVSHRSETPVIPASTVSGACGAISVATVFISSFLTWFLGIMPFLPSRRRATYQLKLSCDE